MEIGIRELRDGLSRHLAVVRAGHAVTVTDHGRPVARSGDVEIGDQRRWSAIRSLTDPPATNRFRSRPLAPLRRHDAAVGNEPLPSSQVVHRHD